MIDIHMKRALESQKNVSEYLIKSKNLKFTDLVCGNTRINISRQRKYIFENGWIFVVFQLDSASFKPIGGRFAKKIRFFSVEFSNIILEYECSL